MSRYKTTGVEGFFKKCQHNYNEWGDNLKSACKSVKIFLVLFIIAQVIIMTLTPLLKIWLDAETYYKHKLSYSIGSVYEMEYANKKAELEVACNYKVLELKNTQLNDNISDLKYLLEIVTLRLEKVMKEDAEKRKLYISMADVFKDYLQEINNDTWYMDEYGNYYQKEADFPFLDAIRNVLDSM